MKAKKKDPRIPVTILSGFLGSGKTTLLQYILQSREHKLKVAVIVNDMAELNIDAAMVGGGTTSTASITPSVVQTKREVISLSNGCICCTLRGDLIREINRIQEAGLHDYILIESTGIAEPQQVAESFCADPDTAALAEDPSQMLWNLARLDTCVTVLDAYEFPRLLGTLDRFKERFNDGLDDVDDEGEGDKSIADLLIEQVEFANVLVLNKIDLVSETEQAKLRTIIKSLNPKAKIVATQYGKLDLKDILNTKSFSMADAEESRGWLVSLQRSKEGVIHSESDEYGISSFVYRARKPFHPTRLAMWVRRILHFSDDWNNGYGTQDDECSATMQKEFGTIFRSKGFCWIAGRDDIMSGWAHSGRLVLLDPTKPWYSAIPKEEWEIESDEEEADIRKDFDGPFGDRRQEIVFIGIGLKQEALVTSLNECLLDDTEMKQHSVSSTDQYHDMLPPWLAKYEIPGTGFAPILRFNQMHKFSVSNGLVLRLTNLALEYVPPIEKQFVEEDDRLVAVKVWLDRGEGREKHCRLLATLRPGQCEQYSLAVEIMTTPIEHDDDPSSVLWLRMEPVMVVHSPSRKQREANNHKGTLVAARTVAPGVGQQSPWRVHAMGSITMLQTMKEVDGDDDDDDDDNDACHVHQDSRQGHGTHGKEKMVVGGKKQQTAVNGGREKDLESNANKSSQNQVSNDSNSSGPPPTTTNGKRRKLR